MSLTSLFSRVLPTVPNTVPVSREVFDTLHSLEVAAFNLPYDCLHPAFERYGNIARDTRAVVERFGTHRASFTTNSTALEDARRSLEDAAGNVRNLLVRYRFMENLVKEWGGRSQIGGKFKGGAADQKWIHGVVSTETQDTPQVSLTDGTVAFQATIEVNTRNILPHTHLLRFECRELQTVSTSEDPSTLILTRPPCYIVGWTLSCRTKQPGPKIFSVISGGVLGSNLTINVKGPIFRQADWRCRIYFVDREDYNFPHLTSK